MNVFDFDKTIYSTDSTVDFYLFCLKKYPIILKCLPKQILGILKYKLHCSTKENMKEAFFCFLSLLKDVDCEIDAFVKSNAYKIQQWYIDIHKETDVVISASPEFLIERFSRETTGFKVIASKVDKKTGQFQSQNCYGEEKVKRFREEYPVEDIECFYSDSSSDLPMAKIAKQAYLVKRDKFLNY